MADEPITQRITADLRRQIQRRKPRTREHSYRQRLK